MATLLMIVRAEICSLEQDAAELPPAVAAPLLVRVKRLSQRSRRLSRSTAARLRSH